MPKVMEFVPGLGDPCIGAVLLRTVTGVWAPWPGISLPSRASPPLFAGPRPAISAGPACRISPVPS